MPNSLFGVSPRLARSAELHLLLNVECGNVLTIETAVRSIPLAVQLLCKLLRRPVIFSLSSAEITSLSYCCFCTPDGGVCWPVRGPYGAIWLMAWYVFHGLPYPRVFLRTHVLQNLKRCYYCLQQPVKIAASPLKRMQF